MNDEIETYTVILYAHLASALVNGDTSGLDDKGEKELQEALDYLGDLQIVDVSDPYFGRPETGGLPGEVADYTVVNREG